MWEFSPNSGSRLNLRVGEDVASVQVYQKLGRRQERQSICASLED